MALITSTSARRFNHVTRVLNHLGLADTLQQDGFTEFKTRR